MKALQYRPDIDGLRALAVLLVLLFHLDIELFSGGYIGVDVFYVISGFLITGIICNEISQTNKFSFQKFFIRRTRRLLPAFFLTLILCFVVAVVLYTPQYLHRFGESVLYALANISNFYFWTEAGYFDTNSDLKPLLHTWSLSVEWQFYLFWSAVIGLVLRFWHSALLLSVILILGLCSLYLNIVFEDGHIPYLQGLLTEISANFSDGNATIFYLMPFRIFEFSIGALIVWLINYQPKNRLFLELFVWAGLALIIYSAMTLTKETLFPSYNALLPCIGALLLIYGGSAKYSGRVLNNKILIPIGLISYSLYLVHWPIISFYKYYKLGSLTYYERAIIIFASIALAALIYWFIEKPFRQRNNSGYRVSVLTFSIVGIFAILTVAVPAISAWSNNGWEWRKEHYLSLDDIEKGSVRRLSRFYSSCRILSLDSSKCKLEAPHQVMILGDSHHYVAYNALDEVYGQRRDINLITFGAINDCGFKREDEKLTATGLGWDNRGRCNERAQKLNENEFVENLDVIVISSFFIFAGDVELELLNHIKSINPNIETVILGPYLSVRPYDCSELINRYGSNQICKDEKFVSFFGVDVTKRPLYNSYPMDEILYIDTVGLLCEEHILDTCKTAVSGVPVFYDGDHYSHEFSTHLGRLIYEKYKQELKRIGF